MARRKKAGRPRKEGPRYPSGKLKQEVGPTSELLAKRAELVGEKHATHPDAVWLIGILWLRGELHPPLDHGRRETQEEAQARADVARGRRDAAERFIRLAGLMSVLTGAPRQPHSVDPMHAPGKDERDDPVFYARVRAEYLESIAVLEEAGAMPMMAVIRACRDEWAPLSYLPAGLDALHEAGGRIAAAGRRAARQAREAA